MANKQNHISAIKCLTESNSRFGKVMNLIISDYKLLKLEEAIEKFISASEEYKIEKAYSKQIECLIKIDEIYDKKFIITTERLDKKFQATNLKILIDVMLKENKKNILISQNINFIPYDVMLYIKKYISTSEETADDEHLIKSIDYILKLYENIDDDKIIEFLIELYEKQFDLTQKYDEKYGDLFVKNKNYIKAAEIYESIGKLKAESSTLRFGSAKLFLKSICCYILSDDDVNAQRKFDEIELSYPIIHSDRDFKLSKNIIELYQERDVETFTNIMVEYDSISKISDFHVNLFNLIKKKMTEVDELDLC